MKLFTFATSPYARKVRIVLDHKGAPYEPIERCYSLDRKDDLREASKRAEVPVLMLDDGRMIADSTIICEYLEQVYPTPALYPKDAYDRARMRMIEDLCDRSFDALGFGYYFSILRREAPESAAMQQAAKDECRALLENLECELGTRDFFCGSQPSVADFAAICHVPLANAMRIDTSDLAGIMGWMRRMRDVPAVAADRERAARAWHGVEHLAAEFEGPDGRVHWRDHRLEWPIRHGFLDFVSGEFMAGKMMFPPDAA